MSYLPHPQKEEGGQKELWTADEDVRSLLKKILKELKKINMHFDSIIDDNLSNEEIE